MKVAVIDDDKSVRSSLTRLIKTAGIEVVSFSSAHEFLDDPCLNQIDCAVTDVRMPGVDGFALQKTLAQTQPHLSLVFITGQGDIPMGVKAMKEGAVDFLEKPVGRKALLEAVSRAAERSREQRVSRVEIHALRLTTFKAGTTSSRHANDRFSISSPLEYSTKRWPPSSVRVNRPSKFTGPGL